MIKYNICSNCNTEKLIHNSFHNLCIKCNKIRLESTKKEKTIKTIRRKRNVSHKKDNNINSKQKAIYIKRKYNKGKNKQNLNIVKQDEIFYEKCFNKCKIHRCEECNKSLPDIFKDNNNKIISRFRYSHIVAKSISPELRYNIDNINHLCHTCHFKWDHGDKKSMKIYSKNKEKFPQFLK